MPRWAPSNSSFNGIFKFIGDDMDVENYDETIFSDRGMARKVIF
jgi:hypothetical protein